MLKLPDDEFVTIELVSDPPDERVSDAPGLNHLVIKVESMDATISGVSAERIDSDEHAGRPDSNDIQTRWITDPDDGNRIELVQWPLGQLDGMTAADWPEQVNPSGGEPREPTR
jgi:lactoylglutathione lyase